MFRILLSVLLLSTRGLGAQAPEPPPSPGSGSLVRLVLHSGPSTGFTGAVLGVSGDTLRVVAPELGLAQVPLVAVQRLDVPASTARRDLTAAGVVLASGAVAGIVSMLEGEGFIESFVAATIGVTFIALPEHVSEPRQWQTLPGNPSGGMPPVSWRDEPGGALVRVSAPGQGFSSATLRLRDFRADTVYLTRAGQLTPVPTGEITRLELSMGRNTRCGVAWGRGVGAIAGGLYGGALLVRAGGYGVLLAPLGVASGLGIGGGIGAIAGYLLAPREWASVPVSGRTASSP